MTEIIAFAGVGCAIAAGLSFGTRYINKMLRLENMKISADRPLVRPFHPSGGEWKEPEQS